MNGFTLAAGLHGVRELKLSDNKQVASFRSSIPSKV